MFKRFLPLLFTPLLLVACTKSDNDLALRLTVDSQDPERQAHILTAAKHVVERRVLAMSGAVQKLEVEQKVQSGAQLFTMRLRLAPPELAAPLGDQLTTPLAFRLMREINPGETADITLEQFGGFKDLGITEDHVDWVFAGTDPQTFKGRLGITFTPDGQALLKTIFGGNKGKVIAIFVRNKLVSRLRNDGVAKDNIQISGVPSPDLAEIFADDVNVGSHVHFTPDW